VRPSVRACVRPDEHTHTFFYRRAGARLGRGKGARLRYKASGTPEAAIERAHLSGHLSVSRDAAQHFFVRQPGEGTATFLVDLAPNFGPTSNRLQELLARLLCAHAWSPCWGGYTG